MKDTVYVIVFYIWIYNNTGSMQSTVIAGITKTPTNSHNVMAFFIKRGHSHNGLFITTETAQIFQDSFTFTKLVDQ